MCQVRAPPWAVPSGMHRNSAPRAVQPLRTGLRGSGWEPCHALILSPWFMDLRRRVFSPPICSLLNVRLNSQGVHNISHNLCQEKEHLAGEGRLTHQQNIIHLVEV